MTREEIVKSLNILKEQAQKSHNDTAILNVKIESFEWVMEMAIKALSQEPCDDAISRQAMFKIQAKYAEYMGATKFWQMSDDIKALPPVTPVTQKSGKWIITPASVTKRHYQCSECKYIHTFTAFDYCPKCGAKMESEG